MIGIAARTTLPIREGDRVRIYKSSTHRGVEGVVVQIQRAHVVKIRTHKGEELYYSETTLDLVGQPAHEETW